MNCQWGQKALGGYLGSSKGDWRRYDTCALLEDGARVTDLLVDQGTADQFLETQLKPDLLKQACARASVYFSDCVEANDEPLAPLYCWLTNIGRVGGVRECQGSSAKLVPRRT
jgi:hypothetical protein